MVYGVNKMDQLSGFSIEILALVLEHSPHAITRTHQLILIPHDSRETGEAHDETIIVSKLVYRTTISCHNHTQLISIQTDKKFLNSCC